MPSTPPRTALAIEERPDHEASAPPLAKRFPAQRHATEPFTALSSQALSQHARALARHHPRIVHRILPPGPGPGPGPGLGSCEVVTVKGVDALARTPDVVVIVGEDSCTSGRYLMDRLAQEPGVLATTTVHLVLPEATWATEGETLGALFAPTRFRRPPPSHRLSGNVVAHVGAAPGARVISLARPALGGGVEISASTPVPLPLLRRALDPLGMPVSVHTAPSDPITLAVPRLHCAPLTLSGATLAARLTEVDGALRTRREALGDVSATPFGRTYLHHEDLLCELAARERRRPTASGPAAVGAALAAVTELAGHAALVRPGSYHEDLLRDLWRRTLRWAQTMMEPRPVSATLAAASHGAALTVVVAGAAGTGMIP